MTIEIAERLIKLRKEHGYSQEALADKLGVSRQAVSKWERSESSPDTDNLIELSKIYGITIDEILNNNSTKAKEVEVEEVVLDNKDHSERESVHIGVDGLNVEDKNGKVHIGFNGIHIVNKDKEVTVDKNTIKTYSKNHKKALQINAIVSGVTSLLVLITYICLGLLLERGWEVGWNLFFIISIVTSLISAIIEKRISNFAFPILATAIYTTIGMIWGIWHPSWIVFLFIPIYYIIADPIDKRHTVKEPIEFVKDGKPTSIDIEVTK